MSYASFFGDVHEAGSNYGLPSYPIGFSDNGSIDPNMSSREISFEGSINRSNRSSNDMDNGDRNTTDMLHITKLYELCYDISTTGKSESDIKQDDNKKVPSNVKIEIEQGWEKIRNWLVENPNKEIRARSVEQCDETYQTALHLVCKSLDPPLDVVVDLIASNPNVLKCADNNTWLPLHYACASGASVEVLEALVMAYPESTVYRAFPTDERYQFHRGRTPLHYALVSGRVTGAIEKSSFAEVVRVLSAGRATTVKDAVDMLPLHYACAFGAHPLVLEELTKGNPESVSELNERGQTVLHLALANTKWATSPGVVEYVLSFELDGEKLGHVLMRKYDKKGKSAISSYVDEVGRTTAKAKDTEQMAKCLMIYLDHKPPKSTDLMTALQSLPDWLRSHAVMNTNVQNILNEKVAKRFPTFILFLDIFCLLSMIVCFKLSSGQYINYTFNESSRRPSQNVLNLLYAGTAYFFIREVIQVASVVSLGRLRNWYTDQANWLDVIVILLVFYYTLAMQNDITEGPQFRTGASFTILALWCKVISFIKSIKVDFAVFVGGVKHVLQHLGTFLLALSITLIVFAQIFFFLYTNDLRECDPGTEDEEEKDTFPHCKFETSLLRVYSMLMGEVEMNDYTQSSFSQFVYALFAFLVIILMSNVLIAIVTDSYAVIMGERAGVIFWCNRLDFIAEMDAIRDSDWKKNIFSANPSESSKRNDISSIREEESYDIVKSPEEDPFRQGWQNLIDLYEPVDDGVNWQKLEFWGRMWLRFLGAFVIPFWVLIGFISLGLLLPPQLREFLLVQRTKTSVKGKNEIFQQVVDLRNEIERLRHEVNEKKKQDKWELEISKKEVEKEKKDLVDDIDQIRQIVKTLLNTMKERRRE